ncbi:uncharacterized protein C2845_PM07G39310 [Panicum miliaceum]|uniref:BED-type domain-containing protein n=1 Tax=Panicum miliaceum TaxID=4540 RepID=A0A3L6SJZ1_PANMI|nr:uncharacterized protein C2845_PM07G39310 [Panicum miliaceum]
MPLPCSASPRNFKRHFRGSRFVEHLALVQPARRGVPPVHYRPRSEGGGGLLATLLAPRCTTTAEETVRERDACWEYCDKLDGNKVRCRFCHKVLNGGISRLKFHLSQIPSKGVNPCTKVKEDVIEKVKAIISAKEEYKEFQLLKRQRVAELSVPPKRTREVPSQSTSPGPANSPAVTLAAEQSHLLALEVSTPAPKLSGAANKSRAASELEAERCIAEFFFENKLDYSIADSVSYQHMLEVLGGVGFRGPSAEVLKDKWLHKLKSKLKQMFHCAEYSSSSYASRSIPCVEILNDDELWRAVEEIAAVSEPLLRVMRDVSGGKAAIGYIYESMTKVTDSIRTYYIMDEGKCKSFLDIVEQKWQAELHSPLHSAAAYLNPSIQYNPEVKFFTSIKEEFHHVLDKVLTTPDLRHDITSQLHAFRKAQGMFGSNIAKEARNNTSPGMWWEQYGDSAPSLQRAAVRITSQVCSTLTFQRDWDIILQNHSEKRNKLDKEALADQAYVHYNLTLHSEPKTRKKLDGDPIALDGIDMTSPWVEDSDGPILTQWLDRFPSALDGGDLNTRQFGGSIFGPSDNLFGL